jgi:ApaG protein
MYQESTDGISVEVKPSFLAEHSDPGQGMFVFSYEVTVSNFGTSTVQLMGRHWIIRDGNGVEREVKGDGVVGEQPELSPGASYVYSSYCPLSTPTGSMRGTYRMRREDGEEFQAKIPLFFLRN